MPVKYNEDLYCTQGQGGSFSHTGSSYYGFDFNKRDQRNSESNFAYGVGLFSPVNGTIVDLRDGLSDFQNNSGYNGENNHGWGNTILIRDQKGKYAVRMSHLRGGSTDHLSEGDTVSMGDYIGEIGQTGFSTSPHLHIEIKKYSPDQYPNVSYSDFPNSAPFTFVEGIVEFDDWAESALGPKFSVLDNNEDMSLSHEFGYGNYVDYVPWEWDCGLKEEGAAGKDFCKHFVTSADDDTKFTWKFQVEKSAVYFIFATFPTKPYHYDPSAAYSINGGREKYRTQESAGPFFKFIGYAYFAKGRYHTVSVRGTTPGRDVIADAIVLRRLGW